MTIAGLSRRRGNLLAFLGTAGAVAYAFFAQFGLGLVPCHLCVFQRITLAAGAAVLLAATLHDPDRAGARVYAGLAALSIGATVATAARHVWIQLQPAGSVPACGADLDFMLDVFPLWQVVLKVFSAGGECQKIDWIFLGLSMPGWVLLFASALLAFVLWNNLRAVPRR